MTETLLDQEFARSLVIPMRPEIVAVLFEEMHRDEPNLDRVGRQIAADVGLAAAVLKAANSPAFGLVRKVRSVAQAVEFLGMRHVAGITTGLVLRSALSGGGNAATYRHFWDAAENTALICARFARMLRGIRVDEAYTFGLFHDCGIPLLMQRFPKYVDTLARAQTGAQGFAVVEEADVGTHHGAVGYFLTRSWQLPDDFCRAVLWHHDTEVFGDNGVPGTVRNFVGIVHMAEHILNLLMYETASLEWSRFEAPVLEHFGLDDEDFINFVDEAREAIAGS